MDRTCQKPRDIGRQESFNAVMRRYLSRVLVSFTASLRSKSQLAHDMPDDPNSRPRQSTDRSQGRAR